MQQCIQKGTYLGKIANVKQFNNLLVSSGKKLCWNELFPKDFMGCFAMWSCLETMAVVKGLPFF